MLTEFLQTFCEIQQLDLLCSRMLAPSSPHELPNRQKDLHFIQDALTKLLGPTKDIMRLFSWDFNQGLLSKLRTYCTLFLQNADTDGKELIAIQHYADKIWLNCLQAVDALHELPQDHTSFFSALEKASTATQRFAKQIVRLIPQFKHDENVIFYVLRNHALFDKVYGNRFTLKLFSKIYPKGVKEGQHFLTTKYAERGFEALLPAINAATAEMEAG
jgi:hypothetical protein